MQYPNGGPLTLIGGHLKKIEKEQIQHSVRTSGGSSGSPIIFLLRDHKIIGIHRGSSKNRLNLGTSMKYIIENIKKKIYQNIGKWELR